MKRKLILSRDAETDLTLIWVYYAEMSERAAQRIYHDIVSKYNLILQFPQAGRSRNELQVGLRSLPVGSHVIFYREIEDRIEIMRVIHGSRDIQDYLHRLSRRRDDQVDFEAIEITPFAGTVAAKLLALVEVAASDTHKEPGRHQHGGHDLSGAHCRLGILFLAVDDQKVGTKTVNCDNLFLHGCPPG